MVRFRRANRSRGGREELRKCSLFLLSAVVASERTQRSTRHHLPGRRMSVSGTVATRLGTSLRGPDETSSSHSGEERQPCLPASAHRRLELPSATPISRAYACAYLARTPADGGGPLGGFRPVVISFHAWPSSVVGVASSPTARALGEQPRPSKDVPSAAHQQWPAL